MKKDPKSESKAFLEKLQAGPIFFKNSFENAVIRSEPGKGIFVKFPGEPEFESSQKSNLVTDAILEHNEISEKEYQAF